MWSKDFVVSKKKSLQTDLLSSKDNDGDLTQVSQKLKNNLYSNGIIIKLNLFYQDTSFNFICHKDFSLLPPK